MRSIDRFVGIPLCWLVGLLLKVFRRTPAMGPAHDLNTILVIKFFGMGSILLSRPFLTTLRRTNLDARIVYLSFAGNRELLERFAEVDITLAISTDTLWSFLSDSLLVIRTLQRMSVDVAFDLEFFSKFSTLLSSLSGAAIRVGFSLPTVWRKINLTHPVPLAHSTHVKNLFLHQLAQCGIETNPATPASTLASTSAEQESMEKKLHLDADGSTIIAININAGQASLERRWSPDRFMEVATQLTKEAGPLRIFLTGSSGEFRYVEDARRRHPALLSSSMNCAGLLTLGELIALFERTAVFLTNDSGPMHLAASVGTPVVALFGPESPQFYGPAGTSRIIYKRIACSPCLNVYNAKLFVCPYDARCMKEIPTTEVLEAVRSLLPEFQTERSRT